MEKELQDFMAEVKNWLFGIESGISVKRTPLSEITSNAVCSQLNEYYSKAYNVYGLNLDETLENFPRVKNLYNNYLNPLK